MKENSDFYFKRGVEKWLSDKIYKNSEILNDFDKAIEIEEKPEYYIERGLLKFDILNFNEGIKDLKIASTIFKNYKNLHDMFFDAGMKCAYKNRYAEALECISMAIELNKTEAEYYNIRGEVTLIYINDNENLSNKLRAEYSKKKENYYAIKDSDEKKYLDEYKKNKHAMKKTSNPIEPKEVTFNKTIDNLKSKKYNFDSAISDFSEAINLNENHEYYFNRGKAITESPYLESDIDKAINDFSKAISLKREDKYYEYECFYILRKWKDIIKGWESCKENYSLTETKDIISQINKAYSALDYVKENYSENPKNLSSEYTKLKNLLSFLKERENALIWQNRSEEGVNQSIRLERERNKYSQSRKNKLFDKYLSIFLYTLPLKVSLINFDFENLFADSYYISKLTFFITLPVQLVTSIISFNFWFNLIISLIISIYMIFYSCSSRSLSVFLRYNIFLSFSLYIFLPIIFAFFSPFVFTTKIFTFLNFGLFIYLFLKTIRGIEPKIPLVSKFIFRKISD